jgi:hypothetical protein
VAYNETVAAAGKTPVCYQGDVSAETFAYYRAGRAQHLAHTGAPFRSFIANDNHVAGGDFIIQNRLQGEFL